MTDREHNPVPDGTPEKFPFVYFLERGFCIVKSVTGLQNCPAEITQFLVSVFGSIERFLVYVYSYKTKNISIRLNESTK